LFDPLTPKSTFGLHQYKDGIILWCADTVWTTTVVHSCTYNYKSLIKDVKLTQKSVFVFVHTLYQEKTVFSERNSYYKRDINLSIWILFFFFKIH